MQKLLIVVSLIAILALNVGIAVNNGSLNINTPGVNITNEGEGTVGNMVKDDYYTIHKLVEYGDITTTGLDLISSTTGALILDDIIIKTDDSVAMASGTLFKVVVDGNDYGNPTIYQASMSNMGAAKTFDFTSQDLGTASTSNRTVIEDGSLIRAVCTTADCNISSTGYLDITMVFKKTERTANVY